MTPLEIKTYFDSNPPPPTFELHPWAVITDCDKFLLSTYSTLANHKGNYEDCPAFWRLKEFYKEMQRMQKKTSSESIEIG